MAALGFPAGCQSCGGRLPPAAGEPLGRWFCDGCRAELTADDRPLCDFCGVPLGPHLDRRARCYHCRGDRFAFDSAASAGVYAGDLRRLVTRAKPATDRGPAVAAAELLWDRSGDRIADWSPDVVCAVPAYRRIGRPLPTAAEHLARHLAATLDRPFRRLVAKVRPTAKQASLSPTARRQNLRDAFRLARRSGPKVETVLLVDDVLTTGTTADRVARVLLEGVAERVVVAVATRGIGQSA